MTTDPNQKNPWSVVDRFRPLIGSIIVVVLAALLPVTAEAATPKSISSLNIDPIDNQIVEVVTKTKSPGSVYEENYISPTSPELVNYLNSHDQFPFGTPNNDGVTYSYPSDATDGTYILYSFGATPTVTLKDGDYELVEGQDYELSFSSNLQPGTATVTISGLGAYQGTKTETFSIIGYRVVNYDVSSSGSKISYAYHWGGTRTWPNLRVEAGSTGESVMIVLKDKSGKYVALGSNHGLVYPNQDEVKDSMSMDADKDRLHPNIDSSRDADGNFLWSEYPELVSSVAEQSFDTPVDRVRIYMASDILARYQLPSWELNNAHLAWTNHMPASATEGWSLASIFASNQSSDPTPTTKPTALYAGQEGIRNLAPESPDEEAAKDAINTGTISFARSAASSGSIDNFVQFTGLSEQEVRQLVSIDLQPIDNAPETYAGGLYTLGGFEVTLRDNGLMDKIQELVDQGYFVSKCVSGGKLVDVPLSREPIKLTFNGKETVYGSQFCVIPYDLTDAEEYSGNGYSGMLAPSQKFVYQAMNNQVEGASSISQVTHGATIKVNDGRPLVATGESLDVPLVVSTAFQENILDDPTAVEGTDYQIAYERYVDETTTEAIEESAIKELGRYRVTVKGTYTAAELKKLGLASQSTKRYCGSASQDFEVVAEGTSDTISTEALDKAISDAKTVKAEAADNVVAADALADKEDGFPYYTPESAAAFDAAIAEAEDVAKNPTDQATVDAACDKLKDAVAAFTSIAHKVNVDDLKTAQEAAQAKLDSTSPSSDGGKTTTDGETLAKDANWSDATAYDALKSKADEAKGILDKEEGERGVTQNQVAALVEALEDQTEALVIEKAAGPGTSTEKINLMNAAISLKMAGFTYDGEHAITMETVLQDVKLNGKTLMQDTDFSASFKGKDDNKTYASITLPGDYYVVITGIGGYTGSASKSFTVTKASTEQPSGLAVATSAHENGMVYLTGYLDGNQVALSSWTTTPQNVAIVTDTNKDGVLEVAFQAPGTVTISVQTADAKTAKVVMSSSIAPEGETVDTTKLTDDASGVEVDGLSKKSVEQDGMRLVVKSGNDAGILSSVDTTKEGNRSIGMYDVRLYIGDTEVQPAGSITISFPVDVTSVPDGMKMVAYHWHGSTTTPKEVVHEKIENGKALFTVRELSPFEVALVQNDGTDEHDIASASVVGLKGTYYATSGQPLDLGVSLVSNGKTLVNGTDYEVQLQRLNDEGTGYAPVSNAEKSGVYKLLFTGKGDYTGVLFSSPFNIVVDGDMTGIDDSLIDDPDRNNQNLGSNLDGGSGGSGTGLSDTGTKGSSLAQTGDRQLVNLLALMAMILGAGGVSLFSKRRGKKIRLPF